MIAYFIQAPNLNALGTVNLLGLDLGGNHFFNEALSFLNDVGTLKYLALDDNLYTEMPEICNPLLYELKFQKNKLR